jgi:hypothetical protein
MKFKSWLFSEVFENKDIRSFVQLYDKVLRDLIDQINTPRLQQNLQSDREYVRNQMSMVNELNPRTMLLFLHQQVENLQYEAISYPAVADLVTNAYQQLSKAYNDHFPLQGSTGVAIANDMIADKVKDRTFKSNTVNYLKHEIVDLLEKILYNSGTPQDFSQRDMIRELTDIRRNVLTTSKFKTLIKRLKNMLYKEWQLYLNGDYGYKKDDLIKYGNQLRELLERAKGLV